MLDIGAKRTALIADDDEYFRIALTRILSERLGFAEVLQTSSFDEAVERLEEAGPVSLAVFDLSMPGIDSPAALRTIRTSFAVERLAVVSASRRRHDVLVSLEAGAHGFVSKAQGAGELQAALQQILRGTVYVPPTLADLESGGADRTADMPCRRAQHQSPRITRRQRDVLEMLVEGKSNKEIARALRLGPGTVKVHLAALFRNLGVANRAAAAVAGARLLEHRSEAPELSMA